MINPDSPRPHNGAGHRPGAAEPGGDPTPRGRIEVTPAAIATLAGQAIEQSYGVVGLASRHSRPGLAELLRREDQHKEFVEFCVDNETGTILILQKLLLRHSYQNNL